MRSNCLLARFTGLFLVFVLYACKKQDASLQQVPSPAVAAVQVETVNGEVNVPLSWYTLELKLIRETPGFSPPVSARAIAYTGIALHEAVVGRSANAQTLGGQLNGLPPLPPPSKYKQYNWAIAANSALAYIIKQLFPNVSAANLQLINQLDSTNKVTYANNCSADVMARSVAYGEQVATLIYQWSLTDGGKDGYLNNFPADYIPPAGPGLWVPTPPAFQRAMLPYWGNNRTMLKPHWTDAVAYPPVAYSTDTASNFYKAARLVYQKGVAGTPAEKNIALYWADGAGTFTPPGHLIAIATQLIGDNQLSLSAAANLLAQVGISLNDGGIKCWKYKFHYNVLRPVTYIRSQIDSTWSPLIGTPPFPSYTSGHATFTSAAGNVMAAKFGSSYAFTDQQKVPEGFAPRSFSNFNQMIDEASISRVYGGIHYDFDSEFGKVTGKQVSDRVVLLKY
ncbi:PAP2 superfamily protein [Chitinophaga jiangningensis]|uniref:PAP2 superfamily protein n=1 Tax=Chitinophaga jiangningensis TaxID=1419482 RepID=A0A1M7CI11_9BACT|nr:vanadium-dependent haloperoxidase [Chitinophaga jiangningensis]SHL66845.1 PAP2 superfamily protein [Chitinophaga jiangningensis]